MVFRVPQGFISVFSVFLFLFLLLILLLILILTLYQKAELAARGIQEREARAG